MQSVSFKIDAIENGWFDVEFRTFSKTTAISASNKWGNDAPKHLIKLVNKLVSGKIESGYVSFDETPGTYVLFIDNSGDTSLLYVLYSREETCHWKDFHTYGEMSLSEFTKEIPVKEVLFFAEIDLMHFAESVYKAFDLYTDKKHIEMYEENWSLFPVKDFNKLENLTHEDSFTNLSFITA